MRVQDRKRLPPQTAGRPRTLTNENQFYSSAQIKNWASGHPLGSTLDGDERFHHGCPVALAIAIVTLATNQSRILFALLDEP